MFCVSVTLQVGVLCDWKEACLLVLAHIVGILGPFAKLGKVTIRFMYVRPSAWYSLDHTGQIFMKF